jgi:hypothetical protein
MKYQLKEWETWESEAIFHPPKFCPNCGKPLKDYYEYWVDSSRPETPDNPYKGVGYDCYCPHCEWSGNIEPDLDRDIVHEIGRSEK